MQPEPEPPFYIEGLPRPYAWAARCLIKTSPCWCSPAYYAALIAGFVTIAGLAAAGIVPLAGSQPG